jgi:hypothetical protein
MEIAAPFFSVVVVSRAAHRARAKSSTLPQPVKRLSRRHDGPRDVRDTEKRVALLRRLNLFAGEYRGGSRSTCSTTFSAAISRAFGNTAIAAAAR